MNRYYIKRLVLGAFAIIVGYFALVEIGNANWSIDDGSSVTYGVGGLVEQRCVAGYKHTISNGKVHQIMDEFGKGVRC